MARGKRLIDHSMSIREMNLFRNLWKQVEKVYSIQNRQGQGYRGTYRYSAGMKSFVKFCAARYGLRNIKNIQDKHIHAYVEHSFLSGISTKTVTTDLSAIRKLHGLVEGKHEISSNNQFRARIDAFEKAWKPPIRTEHVDRAAQLHEFEMAMHLARQMQRMDVVHTLPFMYHAGLRIEEATALTKTQLREALRTGMLHLIQTKGGLPRDVPVRVDLVQLIHEILNARSLYKTDRLHWGHPHTHRVGTHHAAQRAIQDWIGNHRERFQDRPDGMPELTAHTLRHAYARHEYEARIGLGMSEKQAKLEVSNLLGHGRDEVTLIYLPSI